MIGQPEPKPDVLVRYHSDEVPQMRHAKQGDAGYDLYYVPETEGEEVQVGPCGLAFLPSGMDVKVPDGFVGLILPRSSALAKRGLLVITGVIDSGYTGALLTQVFNPGSVSVTIAPFERLAQIVVVPCLQNTVRAVRTMPTTARGATGFGSTGR